MIVRIDKRIITIILIFVLILGVCVVFVVKMNQKAEAAWSVGSNLSIIIDAGHGGADGGAVAEDGTMEKNLNLDIALRLRDLLELSGYQVYMTRSEDISLCEDPFIKKEDMQNRINLAREYPQALFISIHLNKFSMPQDSGAQVFYSNNHEDSFLLAQSIQDVIRNNLQPSNTRQVKVGNDNSILLRSIEQPAVIVEGGFLSNKEELALLQTEQYRAKLSYCIYMGIVTYQQEKDVN